MLNLRLIINSKVVLFYIISLILITTWWAKSQDFPLKYSEESEGYYKHSSTLADSNITLVGVWPWGQCLAVEVRDNYAFIGNGMLIQVLDISDPSIPTVVGEYNTWGLVKDIKLRDSLAFVCSNGFQIFNITNLNSIYEVGQLDITAAKEVVVSDSFAYVLAQYTPPLVYVIDITNVNEPYIRSYTPTASDFEIDMDVKDRFIYVTGYNWGFLTIIDARNPDGLVHYDQLLTSSAIEIRDTLMYLGKGGYLGIFSIANPIEPVFLDSAFSGVELGLREMIVQGNYAYSTNDSGLFVFDITNPSHTFVVGHLRTRKAASLAIQGDLLHIATGPDYRIVNIKNVDSLFKVANVTACASVSDIVIQDQYGFVSTSASGVAVLDLSDPVKPVKVGECRMGDKYAYVLDLKGEYAYVGGEGLWTINISNPITPFITDYIPSSIKWVNDIKVGNNKIYSIDSLLNIYDIQNPAFPNLISRYEIPLPAHRIDERDDILFIVTQDSGLVILNVSNPLSVYEITRLDLNPTGILVGDSVAYVADEEGLSIIDITKSNFPLLSYIITPGSRGPSVNMALYQKYLYMSYGTFVSIDVSNPADPKIVGRSGGSGRIAVKNEYIFECNIFLYVLKNDLITSVNNGNKITYEYRLYQNYPNPFNPTTMIRFDVKRSSFMSLKLYSVIGNELETIFEGWKTPGQYDIKLNASKYPSGVYYYRLKSGEFEQTKKMIIVR